MRYLIAFSMCFAVMGFSQETPAADITTSADEGDCGDVAANDDVTVESMKDYDCGCGSKKDGKPKI